MVYQATLQVISTENQGSLTQQLISLRRMFSEERSSIHRQAIHQEYPAEPLQKIAALQAILELAGKFLTGIEILLGIYW